MLGVRLDEATEVGLSRLAKRTGRSKSDIAREVLARHVRLNDERLRAEAARQSKTAASRGWSEEDAYWESLAAGYDFEAAPPGEQRD